MDWKMTTFKVLKGCDLLADITTYNADGTVNTEATGVWERCQRRFVEGICPNDCGVLDLSDPHKQVCAVCGFAGTTEDEFRI
jgi:hypothetical protein